MSANWRGRSRFWPNGRKLAAEMGAAGRSLVARQYSAENHYAA